MYVYHVICASLGLLVHLQTLFARKVVLQYFPGARNYIECHLGALLVIMVLVWMYQYGQGAIAFFYVGHLDVGLNLQHLERIKIEVCGTWTK